MDVTEARGSGQPLRVFLLDDHEVVRRGLRDLLEAEPDIEVVGEGGTCAQALVRASLLHQAMEWPELRRAARASRHGPGYAQVLIRLGYGPKGSPTPRLAVSEVLDPEDRGFDRS